jgi:hypothetical protein
MLDPLPRRYPVCSRLFLPRCHLGFCHAWGKSRKGKNVVRQVTAKKRYARTLAAVTDWCRTHRHLSIPDQHAQLVAKMRGHYAYTAYRETFDDLAGTPMRSQGSGRSGCRGGGTDSHGIGFMTSSSGTLSQQPESSTATPLRAKLSREEPEAGNLHIRVCEG